jgi:predicted flap endonuclease-1-like 5' DNA nuclease
MTRSNRKESDSGLPTGIGKPALRALTAAGYAQVDQLASVTEAELLELHGVGPKAIRVLRDALQAKGLAFVASDPVQHA